jgi:hypothetical protein
LLSLYSLSVLMKPKVPSSGFWKGSQSSFEDLFVDFVSFKIIFLTLNLEEPSFSVLNLSVQVRKRTFKMNVLWFVIGQKPEWTILHFHCKYKYWLGLLRANTSCESGRYLKIGNLIKCQSIQNCVGGQNSGDIIKVVLVGQK